MVGTAGAPPVPPFPPFTTTVALVSTHLAPLAAAWMLFGQSGGGKQLFDPRWHSSFGEQAQTLCWSWTHSSLSKAQRGPDAMFACGVAGHGGRTAAGGHSSGSGSVPKHAVPTRSPTLTRAAADGTRDTALSISQQAVAYFPAVGPLAPWAGGATPEPVSPEPAQPTGVGAQHTIVGAPGS
jgi:hypothetical protein